MQTDPSRWLVAFAGFTYDWIITREWKAILLLGLPIYLVIGLITCVYLGGRGNPRSDMNLASWYLELGNEEIADWEAAWAPETEQDEELEDATTEATADPLVSGSDAMLSDNGQQPPLSPFAETLFRKVQMLNPGDRSQFVIGLTLAQKGAVGQAEQILRKIAPDEGAPGYPQAHLVLADLYKRRIAENPKYLNLVLYHLVQAARWNRIPMEQLIFTVELLAKAERFPEAINLQATAAERDPTKNIGLGRLGERTGNVKLAERARRTAEQYLLNELEKSPQDQTARIELASLYVDLNRIDDAHKQLFDGLEGVTLTPEMNRNRSQLYILKYKRSTRIEGSQANIELGLLDQALRLDPTNPNVAQEVARLAAAGVQGASEDLVNSLKSFLASGKATVGTNALLAETYLAKGDLKQAIPHLEQVVTREPNAADYANNLAYCLAIEEPERIDQAIELCQQAIAGSKGRNPDYYDTYAMALDIAGRSVEAIAAITIAIEKNRGNPEYQRRASEIHRNAGNEDMANLHATLADELQAALDASAAQASSPAPTGSPALSNQPTQDSAPTGNSPAK